MWLVDWVNSHGIVVVLIMGAFSGLVSMLPTVDEIKTARPAVDPLWLLVWGKLYGILHLAANNWAKVVPQLRMLGNGNGKANGEAKG